MKTFRKILKVSLIALLSLTLLLLVAGLSILRWPQLIVNPRVLGYAAKFSPRFGLEMSWKSVETKVESPGWLHKRIYLNFHDLCVKWLSGDAHGCFEPFEIDAELAWKDGGLKLLRAGPVNVAGSDIFYRLAKSTESQALESQAVSTESRPSEWQWDPPALLREAKLGKINIELKKVEIVQDKPLFTGDLGLTVEPNSQDSAALQLRAAGVCASPPGLVSQLCFKDFSLAAGLSWAERRLQLTQFGPVQLSEGSLTVNANDLPERKSGPTRLELDLPELVLPEALRNTRFEALSLDFPNVEIVQGEQRFIGNLKLDLVPDAAGHPSEMKVAAASKSGSPVTGEAVLTMKSASGFLQNDWVLGANADLHMQSGLGGRAKLDLSQTSPKHFRYSLDASFKKPALNGTIAMHGTLSTGHLQGTLSGEVGGFSKQVHKVSTGGCQYKLSEVATTESRGHLSLDCPLRAHLTPVRLPSATYQKYITLPHNLDFIIKTEVNGSLSLSMDKPIEGTADITLVPFSQDLLKAKGNTVTRFAGVPSAYPKGWTLITDLDLFVEMPQFQKLVKDLERTAYPVPAPLAVLQGSVEIGVSGQADIQGQTGKLPVVFNTRLGSKEQKFDTDGKGELTYKITQQGTQSQLEMELALSDLQLALPSLGISAIPNLFPDPRLTPFSVQPPATGNDLKYKMRIYTPYDHPARLVSNVAKQNIPIILDLTAQPGKLDGTVRMKTAAIRFFRRDAVIENFNLTLVEPRDASPVDGRVRVTFSDAVIDIIVLGTYKRPRIIFQSEPPMPEEQIISYLIYGRNFENLDENQSRSVGGVAGAAGDRAITLASLFLLGSTPIESVSYNPATKDFAARVRLAEGTSLNVGSTEGKTQHLGIRKALGRNWIINTYIENNSETNQQSGGASLDYFKRY